MNHTATPFHLHTFPASDGHQRLAIGRRHADGSGSKEYQLSVSRAFQEIASHDALVAACRAALHELKDLHRSGVMGPPPISLAVVQQLEQALAAAGEEGLDVDPEYEAMIADVGLHGENAEPQAMSDPLPLLDGSIRGGD